MTEHDHDTDPRSLLGAHALDALDEVERRRVDRLLETDADARDEAERLGRVADRLGEAAAEGARAPADLLDRIMGQLDLRDAAPTAPADGDTASGDGVGSGPSEPLRPAASAPASVPAPASAPAPAPASEPRTDAVASLDAHRARRRAPWILSAAAAVILVIVGAVVVGSRDSGTTDPNQALREIAEQVQSRPGTRTAELLAADDTVMGTVVVDAEGTAFVLADNMAPLDDAHTYQLWAVDGGTPVSVGLLGSAPGVAVVGLDANVTQLAVTTELAGGSAQPTTAPAASGHLTA